MLWTISTILNLSCILTNACHTLLAERKPIRSGKIAKKPKIVLKKPKLASKRPKVVQKSKASPPVAKETATRMYAALSLNSIRHLMLSLTCDKRACNSCSLACRLLTGHCMSKSIGTPMAVNVRIKTGIVSSITSYWPYINVLTFRTVFVIITPGAGPILLSICWTPWRSLHASLITHKVSSAVPISGNYSLLWRCMNGLCSPNISVLNCVSALIAVPVQNLAGLQGHMEQAGHL